jgi:hypothetical protein
MVRRWRLIEAISLYISYIPPILDQLRAYALRRLSRLRGVLLMQLPGCARPLVAAAFRARAVRSSSRNTSAA